ncbi:MAG: DUF58 domain-containing protein [Myxococcota bacterium]
MARRWSFFMSPLEHRSIRELEDSYRGQLTVGGRVLLWGSVAAGILLLGGLQPPLMLAFAFCASALVCAFLVGAPFRPRVNLQRHLPPPASAGDVLTYQVTVRNDGRRPLRHVVVEERKLPPEIRPVGEPPLVELLEPGEQTRVTLKLSCSARGAYELRGLQAGSCFPTGLVKWTRRSPSADRLLVYPRFTPLESFEVPHGRNYQPGGIAVASQIGESTEFSGTREWREGDRVRDIHWPSYARTGELIIKEFQEEYFVRLAMVLDVEVKNAKQERLFERGLSLAAGIADVLARKEYIIDLFAAGQDIFHFQAGRALAHFENILEILACVEPGRRLDVRKLESVLVPEASKLSAIIFVMMDWDPSRADLVQLLKQHGVAVRVLCMNEKRVPDGLSPEEVVPLQ